MKKQEKAVPIKQFTKGDVVEIRDDFFDATGCPSVHVACALVKSKKARRSWIVYGSRGVVEEMCAVQVKLDGETRDMLKVTFGSHGARFVSPNDLHAVVSE